VRETLQVTLGQWAEAGRKPQQQDFHGARIPVAPLLGSKGVVLAIADGLSSSEVGHEASQQAVSAFLADYYCTADAWSVKTAAERVLRATNAWLHAQTQRSRWRDSHERGYLCTFSALVLKGRTAHVVHVGDTRIGRVVGHSLEPLTTDHRVEGGDGRTWLGRAMGAAEKVEIDYRAVPVSAGDVFVLSSDGVHEHVDARYIAEAIARQAGDLNAAARTIVDEALQRGSDDNLTVQLVRVDSLPEAQAGELVRQLGALPMPPPLVPRLEFDGYTILRELHASHRSQLHLARDEATGETVAIKVPSTEMRADPVALERFLLEEWVARRIDHPHVLKPRPPVREGGTLSQWMRDHPQPSLAQVRGIVAQIAQGLRAFHRLEMLHQDLRPDNVMIDAHGMVKIIDFGAVRVAGLDELASPGADDPILGTVQYTAPEYFVGEPGTPRSDLYSLGVITYQMLCGRLPYGAQVARLRSRAGLASLRYASVLDAERAIPAWVDAVLQQAVHPEPARRHEALSEFVHDLHHPRPELLRRKRAPWTERNPAAFWRGTSMALMVIVLLLLYALAQARVPTSSSTATPRSASP
jgi:serine/threonine protein phosphatase PrpC